MQNEVLTNDGQVASEILAETLIGQRLFWEHLRK
jgi:hypothetical protein